MRVRHLLSHLPARFRDTLLPIRARPDRRLAQGLAAGILLLWCLRGWNHYAPDTPTWPRALHVPPSPGPQHPSEYPVRSPDVQPQDQPALSSIEINTADSLQWASLPGIGPVLSGRIVRYRAAYGPFRQLEELKAVYGLPQRFDRIRPYLYLDKQRLPPDPATLRARLRRHPKNLNTIRLEELRQYELMKPWVAKALINYRNAKGGYFDFSEVRRVYGMNDTLLDTLQTCFYVQLPPIDLNTVDAERLEQLPCLGKVLSERIVKYRSLLGGFHRLEQLAEVYRLSDACYTKLRPVFHLPHPERHLRKIPINRVAIEELRQHPYFESKPLLLAIDLHRTTVGPFRSKKDFCQLEGLSADQCARLAPYLSFE